MLSPFKEYVTYLDTEFKPFQISALNHLKPFSFRYPFQAAFQGIPCYTTNKQIPKISCMNQASFTITDGN